MIITCQTNILGVDILAVDISGVDILGVDILGVDILGRTHIFYTNLTNIATNILIADNTMGL